MKTCLQRLAASRDLSQSEMTAAFDAIMAGEVPPSQLGAFLMGLRAKGETAEELSAAAASMRRHAVRVDAGGPSIDTCGTGGDSLHTSISTTAAFVVARRVRGKARQQVRHKWLRGLLAEQRNIDALPDRSRMPAPVALAFCSPSACIPP